MSLKWLEQLVERLSRQAPPGDRDAWAAERRRTVQRIAQLDVTVPEVEAEVIAMTHDSDGYVREAAVSHLRLANSDTAFRASIERMNDWVPQVRLAASLACDAYLTLERVDILFACLDAVLDLASGSRADHGEFLARVDGIVDHPDNRNQVLRLFAAGHGPVARYLLSRMLTWNDVDSGALARLAAAHGDFSVRAMLVGARRLWTFPECMPYLYRLAADRHPRIRKLALGHLCEVAPQAPETGTAIERCLLDPAKSVRDFSLWCIRDRDFDMDAHLAKWAADFPGDQAHDTGLLGLLGSHGSGEWLPLVRQAITDHRPAVRRAALAAWASLDRNQADLPVAAALNDASGKVHKLALRLVQKGRVALSSKQIADAANTAVDRRGFARLVAIAHLMPFWEQLELLLEATPKANTEQARGEIVAALMEWEGQRQYAFSSIAAEQRQRLRASFARSGLA